MKLSTILTAIVFTAVTLKTCFAENLTELFTPEQNTTILRTIDNVCGDTWCEGDYNFKFITFSCEKEMSTCHLNFRFIKSENDEDQILSPIQVCHFKNIKSYDQVMEGHHSLNGDFLDRISDCISNKESSVKF